MKKQTLRKTFEDSVQAGKFYHFKTAQDFNDRVNSDGKKISKKVKFEKGLEDKGIGYTPPTRYCAYGITR